MIEILQAEYKSVKLTPDEFAQIIEKTKPHLIQLEEWVAETNYGELNVVLKIRAGVVEGMELVSHKNWLRPKNGHLPNQ